MKIKIIDLLNKIANGESVPLKIKYDKVIWEYDKDNNDYYSDEWLFSGYLGNSTLNEFCNDEAKIIEEEKAFINLGNDLLLPKKFTGSAMYRNGNITMFMNLGSEEEKKIELPEKLDGSIGYLGWNSEAVVITNKINETLDYLKYKEEESKK